MKNQPIQVLIVDHHPIVRKGMRALLNEYEDIHLIGEAEDADRVLDLIQRLRPDVVVVDLSMPRIGGIEVIKNIIAVEPTQYIIAIDAFLGQDLFPAAFEAGARCCLLKDAEMDYLIQAIRQVRINQDTVLSTSRIRGISAQAIPLRTVNKNYDEVHRTIC